MEEKDRQFMLKIAERLGKIEDELRFIKGAKPTVAPKPLIGSNAANKFFGASVSDEPKCSGNAIFKDEDIETKVKAEVEHGTKMLRKAVMEFCAEFDIKELNISYTDPTPKKKKAV